MFPELLLLRDVHLLLFQLGSQLLIEVILDVIIVPVVLPHT